MSALKEQVGGKHYKGLKVQPVQVAYQIGASPLWLKVAKYVIRDKTDRQEDFKKAIHCIQLENEMMELRIKNYSVAMMEYDHKEIRDFSEQFEDSELINTVLQKMYFGFFKTAAEELSKHLVEFDKEGGQ